MNQKISFTLIGICILFFSACKEEMIMPPSDNGKQPEQIMDISVENRPGGAKLIYTLPNDANLLYVKAVYEYPAGNIREVKASAYVDTLLIEGVGSTAELPVKLYSVSRSEKISEPVEVKINPLTPPVQTVEASLVAIEDFGGISVSYKNDLGTNIVIEVLKKEENTWVPLDTYYTNGTAGLFSIRGQKSELTEFGLFVRDRWNNQSDTTFVSLTPLYEILLANPAVISSLPGDYNQFYGGLDYTYMFDGIKSSDNCVGTLLSYPASTLPQSFTLDFRKPKIFSRFKYWMRLGWPDLTYNYASPEKWEIWGTNTLSDDWNNWVKIMDCIAVKPSGLPLGSLSSLDYETSNAGLDFNFPIGTPAYRYIRWKTNKTFGSLDAVQISELEFYGDEN